MITGAVSIELYKFAQGFTEIEKFKNGFINLALPLFLFSEPDEVKKTKSKDFDPIMCGPVVAIPEGYTIYDKIVVKQGPLSFDQLFEHLKQLHNVNVTMLACGKICLYNEYLPGNKHAARRPRKIEEVYQEISEEEIEKNYLILELGGETIPDGADFSMPPVAYYFR